MRRLPGRLLRRLLGSASAGSVRDGGKGGGEGEYSAGSVARVGGAGREVGGLHGRLGYALRLDWEPFALVDRAAMIATAAAERTAEDRSTVAAC